MKESPPYFVTATYVPKAEAWEEGTCEPEVRRLSTTRFWWIFPSDTYMHSLQYGISLTSIHACLITHNHSDHLYAPEVENRKIGFCHTEEDALTFYGTAPACRDIEHILCEARMESHERIRVQEIEAFVPFTVQDYTVTPLEANHDPRTQPVIFIIEKEKECLLYANDTGYFPESTWSYLEKNRPLFSLISLDCTEAMTGLRSGHMSLEAVRDVRRRLLEQGNASENAAQASHETARIPSAASI